MTIETPVKFDPFTDTFFVWISTFGIRHTKCFLTPDDAVDWIKNNTQKCSDLKSSGFDGIGTFPYEEWINKASEEQLFYKNTDKNSQEKVYEKQHRTDNANNEFRSSEEHEQTDKKDTGIFSCPSCSQNIRVQIPLAGNASKCVTCDKRIFLKVDDKGNLYITLDGIDETTSEYLFNIDDCLKILGLSKGVSPDAIKKAYKKKVMEYHPDRVSNLGEKIKLLSEKEMKKINIAYSKLKDNGYT